MLGDGILCTSSTGGTGTLTLSTQTGWPDPSEIWTGTRFGIYTIIEWTDATKSVPVQRESGVGTFDTSAGTLDRTKPMSTWVASGTTYLPNPGVGTAPTALNFGTTAANIDIMLTPCSMAQALSIPFVSAAVASVVTGLGLAQANITPSGNQALVHQQPSMFPFLWLGGGQVSQFSVYTTTTLTGGSPTLDCAVYEVGSNGLPGKRLVNFNQLSGIGTANTPYTSTALATPQPLPVDMYFCELLWLNGGGSGTCTVRGGIPWGAMPNGGYTTNASWFSSIGAASKTTLPDPSDTPTLQYNTGSVPVVWLK